MVKKMTKKNNNKEESSREDQFVVLLENMHHDIKLIAEGHLMLEEKMEAGFNELGERMGSMENEIGSVAGEVQSLKGEVQSVKEEVRSLKDEMHMGFKTVIAAIVKNEQEIDRRADKKDLILLDKRVAKLETAK